MKSVVTANGLEMAYREIGRGPAAVFVHPPMLDGTVWLDCLQALGDIRRCLAVDLLGHGASDPDPRPVYRVSDHAADVIGWLDAVAPKDRVDLVGLGLGGEIAAIVFERRPDRVRSLTLISSRFDGHDDGPDQRFKDEYARLAVVEDPEVLVRRFAELTLAADASLPPKARLRSMLERTPLESIVRALDARNQEPRPDLPGKLGGPILIVIGGMDPAGEAVRRFPASANTKTVAFASSGSLAPVEDGRDLNAALRSFWLGVAPPAPVALRRRSGAGQP